MHEKKYAFHNSDEQWKEILTELEYHVLRNKGTEAPFKGKYTDFIDKGVYYCKGCDVQLFSSEQKFQSSCGWPSFDDEIAGSVQRKVDLDGTRTEIVCKNCDGHLGHVFLGERFTEKNTRHCVNSASIIFKSLGSDE